MVRLRRLDTLRERRRLRARPNVELLEGRALLTTFTVINLLDSGSGSLRDAIAQANTQSGATITFAPGLNGTIKLMSPLPSVSTSMTIEGPGANEISLSRDPLNAVSKFSLLDVTQATVAITNLTFSQGDMDAPVTIWQADQAAGGAILNNGGTLTVTQCDFKDNVAYEGGAIASLAGSLTVNACNFVGNIARGGGGGGIYSINSLTVTGSTFTSNSTSMAGAGIEASFGSLTVGSCHFSNNESNEYGGGIFSGSNSVNVSNSTFTNNSSGEGGGIDAYWPTLSIVGSEFQGNSAQTGGGLNLFSTGNASATVGATTFLSNTGQEGGGAIGDSRTALTLTSCTIKENTTPKGDGGGLNLDSASLTVNDSDFEGNQAEGTGGGLMVSDAYGLFALVTLTNTAVKGCQAQNGGGISCSCPVTLNEVSVSDNIAQLNPASPLEAFSGGGINCSHGYVDATGSTFSDNKVIGGDPSQTVYGGAIYAENAYLTDCTISGNTAQGSPSSTADGGEVRGGGIDAIYGLILSGCVVSNNAAIGGASTFANGNGGEAFGGGLYGTGNWTITSTQITGNIARGGDTSSTDSDDHGGSAFGGGAWVSGIVKVVDSTIGGNTARGGDGLAHQSPGGDGVAGGMSTDGNVNIQESTIANNVAQGGLDSYSSSSGGLFNTGIFQLINATVYGNRAISMTSAGKTIPGVAGGIMNWGSGTMTVANSTLASNGAADGLAISNSGHLDLYSSLFDNPGGWEISGSFTSHGHNLFVQEPASVLDATDRVVANPLIGPLASNGGQTLTCALLPGSPAIDNGVAWPSGLWDQRNVTRPQGSGSDIGAFESRGFNLTVVRGNGQVAKPGHAFATPLTVRVTSPYGEPVSGGQIVFNAPASGPSATLSGNPVTIGADGLATIVATANPTQGSYAVTANASGASAPVAFALSNGISVVAQAIPVSIACNALTLPVASFQVTSPPGVASSPSVNTFRALIDWGDGSHSAGKITHYNGKVYLVAGSHRYKKQGSYVITTQILDARTSTVYSRTQGNAVIGLKPQAI